MATGRPDYWYGSVVYVEDTPSDGELTKSPTSNWAYDHENDTDLHGGGGGAFVDRGDPAAYDWTIGDFTVNSAWHDLDCSAIVPDGAVAILFRGYLIDNVVQSSFQLRKNGNVNDAARANIINQVVNLYVVMDAFVACDANRVVEYWVSTGADGVGLTVKGWLLA